MSDLLELKYSVPWVSLGGFIREFMPDLKTRLTKNSLFYYDMYPLFSFLYCQKNLLLDVEYEKNLDKKCVSFKNVFGENIFFMDMSNELTKFFEDCNTHTHLSRQRANEFFKKRVLIETFNELDKSIDIPLLLGREIIEFYKKCDEKIRPLEVVEHGKNIYPVISPFLDEYKLNIVRYETVYKLFNDPDLFSEEENISFQ